MIKFIQYINESKEGKNVHLEHIEDLVFNEGVSGTRKAILFLIELRNMLSGNSKKPLDITTKWDGAPAIFAGIDPADGKFFVAKKGLFNVDPQMFKSIESINQSTLVSELKSKFTTAFTEFSKLGIKSGVYQGDLMFTSEDLRKEKIGEEEFITFQPNTIVYAVPAVSSLAKRLRAAKIGIVWHTTYTGASIAEMKASFGKSIVDKMIPSKSVWMDDATYKDVSGTATFTSDETRIFNSYLSLLGKIFKSLSPAALNRIAANPDFLIRLKTFNNSKVRQGKNITTVSPRAHMQEFISYIKQYYEKEAATKKSQRGKQATFAKLLPMLDYIGTAVKLVDRLEFSTANFSPEILKGWQR
jgi:hypothetical protein